MSDDVVYDGGWCRDDAPVTRWEPERVEDWRDVLNREQAEREQFEVEDAGPGWRVWDWLRR